MIHRPGNIMINDMAHRHGDTIMEIKPLIIYRSDDTDESSGRDRLTDKQNDSETAKHTDRRTDTRQEG